MTQRLTMDELINIVNKQYSQPRLNNSDYRLQGLSSFASGNSIANSMKIARQGTEAEKANIIYKSYNDSYIYEIPN